MEKVVGQEFDLCVLGLGYIGLPTASIFATKGKKVLGVDVRASVVETINEGGNHIQEPDLDVLVKAAVQSGNLRAASEPAPADVYIIAVPTPFETSPSGELVPDLSCVKAATESIAKVIPPGALVILESTSPVGTTERVREWLRTSKGAENPKEDYAFAYCPERILPGQMLKELVANDRISGGLTEGAGERARELYTCFCTGEIVVTDARTAEMVKLAENAFRDVGIAFANEMSMICERLGINVWELIDLANRHPRVNILNPGPGVGGHCIAVDPWFLVAAAPEEAQLIRTARQVNDAKPTFVIEQVVQRAQRFKSPVIACLGLAFKADVDDLRESPALAIVEQLAEQAVGELVVVEPHVASLPASLEDKTRLVDAETAVRAADIVLLLVDHREFKSLSPSLLRERVVIDTRGCWR